jgi:predicted nucleotidyltransferase
MNVIYKCRVGSHAYGMNTPTSDEDFAGIFIPSIEYFFGLKAFDQQIDQSKEVDTTLYSLRKYATLAIANNPNVLEFMFVDPSAVVYTTPQMQELVSVRDAFLSRKCAQTYIGYANAQLHRILSHQKWLTQELAAMAIINPLVASGAISKEWVEWRFGANMVTRIENESTPPAAWQEPKTRAMDDYLKQLQGCGILCPDADDPQFWEQKSKGLVFNKQEFENAKKRRAQYVTWMAERNPKRHEMELKYGYDCKNAAHLIRLLRMGKEILREGKVNVLRPDAQEMLDIRNGKWSYAEVLQHADELKADIDSTQDFAVPEMPDYERINKTIINITGKMLGVTV